MSEAKPFASLTPTLLARKGSARPAMRPQLAPMPQLNEAATRQVDDLGWNDMGHEADTPAHEAEVVRLNGKAGGKRKRKAAAEPGVPDVLVQRATAAVRLEKPPVAASSKGRRAAFTLRLDAERHLRLRLAATITNRSAQQVVTEALDRLLADMPDVATLADQVRKRG